ncbi:hypothetical protein NW754_013436 [Fusarium falciforme]|nr:hypothetical protein NW754_013436 [Fusarium falciforme]
MPTSAVDRDLLTRHHRQSHQRKQDGVEESPDHDGPVHSTQNSPSDGEHTAPTPPLGLGQVTPPPTLEQVDTGEAILFQCPDMEAEPETGSERPTTTTTDTVVGLEPLGLSATSNFLVGAAEGLQEFDFLWSDFPADDQPLPTTFFDTDFSLVDISHQYAAHRPAAGPSRIGALYRFEHAKGVELYRVAKALINWRLDQLHEETISRLTSTSPGYAGFALVPGDSQHDRPSPILSHGHQGIRLLQGLLVLMAITSWGEKALVRDALSMASQVATLVREFGISSPEDSSTRETSWEDWILSEERRRTLFVAYVQFGLQCTAFNVPPMILNQEVRLNLPASAAEWEAQTAVE